MRRLDSGRPVSAIDGGLSGFDGASENIRAVQRAIANVFGMGVVPPSGLVVGHAVDDGVANDGCGQGRHYQAF